MTLAHYQSIALFGVTNILPTFTDDDDVFVIKKNDNMASINTNNNNSITFIIFPFSIINSVGPMAIMMVENLIN